MSTARNPARALAGARPLALSLALAAATAQAVTLSRPGELENATPVLREDGTPLRTALQAWHRDALQNRAPSAPASTHRYVTNCDDQGAGSLRDTIAASASGDTVDLGALACSRISLYTGAIAVRVESLDLVGPASRDLTIDGRGVDRVFVHYGYSGFLLRNLTVAGGFVRATGFHLGIGGCIASAGYLTLDHSTVTGCYAGGEGAYGGAIYAYSLIMSNSALSGNVAYGVHPEAGVAAFGGAAFTYQIDIVDSSITGNAARHQAKPIGGDYDIGGGISTVHGGFVIDSTLDSNYAFGRGGALATFGDIVVRNSTVSGNEAHSFAGGGLFIRYPALLDAANSTIAANVSPRGGGVFFTSTGTVLQSTLIATNASDQSDGADIDGSRSVAVTGMHDLVGRISAVVAVPSDTLRGDPHLLPLHANGGPTRTQALARDSIAVDAGDNTSQLTSDQRGAGYARVVGPAADIGAFELGTPTDPAPVPAVSTRFAALLFALLALQGFAYGRRKFA